MRNLAVPNRTFFLSPQRRTLLMAALLALGPLAPPVTAQFDLAAIRARAEAGDADALNTLGNLAANGQGVVQNDQEAIRLYVLAAERGHAPANFNLGMMHELGRGTVRDLKTAFDFYLKAAEAGFAPAQFNVGNMYANGIGTGQDYFEAAIWFRQAAERNVAEAQYNLGLAYELGRGLVKDETLAQRWYRTAAEQGYARARYNLALMLEEGRGSAPDETAAVQLYRAAAEQGFGPAQNNYGIMLAEGRGGLVANLTEAYVWLALAAENGVAPVGRDLVASRLQPDQLAGARNRLAAIKAQMGGEAAPVAPGQVSDPALAALTARLRSTETNLEILQADNARLDGTVQGLQREKSQLEQRLAQLAAAAQTAPADSVRVQQEQAALQATNTSLTAQLTKALVELKQVRESVAKLQAENQRLGSRPASDPAVPALREQVDRLGRDLNTARQENEALAAQNRDFAAELQAARASQARLAETAAVPATGPEATGDERLARLLADNQRLNDEVKRATIELTSLTRRLRRAEAQSGPVSDAPDAGDRAAGERAELQRQLAEAQAANRQLGEENQRLASRPSADPAMAEKLAATERELAVLRTERQQQAASLAEAQRRLTEAEQKLAAAVAARATGPQDGAESARLKADLAAAQTKLDDTMGLLVTARRETEEQRVEAQAIQGQGAVESRRLQLQLAEATRALEEIRGEKSRLENQLAGARQSQDQSAGAEMRDLVADLAATRARLAESIKAGETAERSRRAQEADNAQLLTQVTNLQREITVLQQRPAAPAESGPAAAKLRLELGAAQEAITLLERDQQRLAGEVVAERKARQAAEQASRTQEADNTQLLAQIENLRREVATLQQRPAAPADGGPVATRLRNELGAARDTIARLEREQQRLTGEAVAERKARQETEQASAGLQAQVGQLRTEMDRLGREKQELVTALGQARNVDQSAKLTAQLDAATRALESREQTITKLGAQIESLNEDLEVARQSAAAALAAQASAVRALPDAGAMQMEMQTLQGQVRSLEAQLQSDQKNAALEIARLADQLQQARETNRALAEANRSLLNSRSAEEALTTGEAEQLNARVRELTAVTERVTRERNDLRAQVEDISARLTDTERLLAQSKQTGDAARGQAQSAQTELAALQAKLTEADHVTERQGATVAELTGLNDRLTREKSAMETQLAQLQGQADRSQKDLAELRDRLAASERLGGIQQANADELAGANEQLQAQVKMLTDQVAALRAETSRLGEQGEVAAASRREIAELTAVNQKLTAELAALRGDSARLVQAEQARQEAEARVASLGTVSTQLATAQRDVTALRAENARLNETMQSLERDRTGRITALQQENAAISARLRQAQGTLDQIASAARLINSGTGGAVSPVRPLGAEPSPPAEAAPQARTHIVVDGDSLSRISLRYYGTPNRWQEIYDANRDSLAGANALRPGQPLRIP